MSSGSKRRTKGIWLVIASLLVWVAPFCVNLWVYGFVFALPIHAVIALVSLVCLCMKDGVRQ